MIIALADVMRGADINYQRHLHVTAVDIDRRAVHMCYTQLSLLHIPAVVILGNSLSLEMQEYWHTPAHILGGWNARVAARRIAHEKSSVPQPTASTTFANPTPATHANPPQGFPQQLSLF
jgi:hypothetical protein